MKIQIKKKVLENFKKKLRENKSSRGDKQFDKTVGFYGNHGSVKSFNTFDEDEDDLPVQPGAHMSQQLSVESPPVEDPDYVPGTSKELGLALMRITKEVPFDKIEFFYRKSHALLDAALDAHDITYFNESVAHDVIPNTQDCEQTKNRNILRHRDIFLQEVINKIETHINQQANVTFNKDNERLFLLNEALDFANQPIPIQRRLLKLLPRFEAGVKSGEISPNKATELFLKSARIQDTGDNEVLNHFIEMAPGDISKDAFVNPPKSLEDIEPKTKKTKKIEDPVSKMKYDPTKSLDDLEGPTSQEMKQLDKDILVKLHDVEKEENESLEFINTWTFDDTVPLNKILYALSISLNEISYEVLRSNYIRKFGGQYLGTPDSKFDSGIKQYDMTHPLSRDYAERFLSSAKGIYGFDTKNILRQHNVVKMSDEELEGVLFNAVSGIINRIPEFKQKILTIIKKHYPGAKLQDTIDFMCELLSRKYRGESLILEKDLIGIVIGGMFKRALIDLPDPVKIPKAPLGHGGNIKSFYKRAKVYPAEFKKYLPDLIMNLLPKFRAGISVKAEGNEITFTDRKTNLNVTATVKDVMDKIKKYIDHMIDEANKPSAAALRKAAEAEEDPFKSAMKTIQKMDTEEDETKEKLNKDGLTKDEAELKGVLIDIKKMVDSGSWMHIAPLFGFSGAPGVRQWFMKFPEMKHKIGVAALRGVPGPSKIMEQINYLHDDVIKFFIDDSNVHEGKKGLMSIMIDELSGKKNLTNDEKADLKLYRQLNTDFLQLADMIQMEDIPTLQAKPEYQNLKTKPGGAVLQFFIGNIFDRVLKNVYSDWQSNAQSMLEAEGVKSSEAKRLSQHFTGLKKVPDFANLKKTALSFINAGITKEKFFNLYEKSYKWFFTNVAEGLETDAKLKKDREFFESSKTNLYKPNGRLNISIIKKIKKLLIEAINNYKEDLGVQIATNRIKAMLSQAEQEFPQLKLSADEQKELKESNTKNDILLASLKSVIKGYL
jgi:hypothetical protein